jgi:ElaB/YqjD/DUF883 family membrane-anchored ribosome-binding protein
VNKRHPTHGKNLVDCKPETELKGATVGDPLKNDRELSPFPVQRDRELTIPEPSGIKPPSLPGVPGEADIFIEDFGGRKPRLHSAAETIGGAMGSAVGSMRRLPQNMKARLVVVGGRAARNTADWKEEARTKLDDLEDAGSESLQELSETASETASELKEMVSVQANRLSIIARRSVRQARIRAAFYVEEYPLQSMMALASVAFVVGCTLRIWRANR